MSDQPLSDAEIQDPSIVIGKDVSVASDADLEEERACLGIEEGQGVALCLSGGGIRSATFSLGVLQALASLGWLERFHYLSTVSGGGYIGSWLSTWIRRSQLDEVVKALSGRAGHREPDQIRRLRASSNYLSPRGGFSGDLLTLVATFMRNLIINWTILIPIFIALTMLPLVNVGIANAMKEYDGGGAGFLRDFYLGFAALFAIISLAYSASDVPDGNIHQTRNNRYREFVFFPVLVACYLLSLALTHAVVKGAFIEETWWQDATFYWFVGAGAVVHLIGVLIGTYAVREKRECFQPNNLEPVPRHLGQHLPRWVRVLIFVALSGAFAGVVIYFGARLASEAHQNVVANAEIANAWSALYSTFAVPFLLVCFFLGTVLYVALIRRNTDEGAREWWGRSGGTWIVLAAAWLGVHGVCVWLPAFLSQFGATFGATTVGATGTLGGILVALIGYYSKHKPDPKNASELDFLERLNIGLLDLLSLAFIIAIIAAITLVAVDVGADLTLPANQIPAAFFGDLNENVAWKILALLLSGLAALSFSWATGVNAFSMHAMYGNRLVRAYLGATRKVQPDANGRMPHSYTGFDPDDDLPMSPGKSDCNPASPKDAPARPFHVINTALNIVRASADHLEWQERKAASFTMTPLRTGSQLTGYCRTRQIGGRADVSKHSALPSGVTIGRAMTISGAAAAPNMGYHSSRLVAIVMTFFNVRLGWWMRNPAPLFMTPAPKPVPAPEESASLKERIDYRLQEWEYKRQQSERSTLIEELCHTEPSFPLRALLAELTGDTREDSDYVYLSDGGHFENLGLYEMVRRKCAEIVLVDASCDPEYEYEDLERAIRIIRNDLNVEITIPELPTAESIVSTGRHYAVGTINYKNSIPGGRILYIKPGMNGHEPLDVTRYSIRSRAKGEPFPHQSTGDQFFDEPQFESYRALGHFSAVALAAAKEPTVAAVATLIEEQNAAAATAAAAAVTVTAVAGAEAAAEPTSAGGLRETLSNLLSWDKLPGLIAALLGAGTLASAFADDETPEAPVEETAEPATGTQGEKGDTGTGADANRGDVRISVSYVIET